MISVFFIFIHLQLYDLTMVMFANHQLVSRICPVKNKLDEVQFQNKQKHSQVKIQSRAHEDHCFRTFGADPSFSFQLIVAQGKHITVVKT